MSAWTSSDSSRIRAERTFRCSGTRPISLVLRSSLPQELDVAVERHEALARNRSTRICPVTTRGADQIAESLDDVVWLNPAPQRIIGVHRGEILLALPARPKHQPRRDRH